MKTLVGIIKQIPPGPTLGCVRSVQSPKGWTDGPHRVPSPWIVIVICDNDTSVVSSHYGIAYFQLNQTKI